MIKKTMFLFNFLFSVFCFSESETDLYEENNIFCQYLSDSINENLVLPAVVDQYSLNNKEDYEEFVLSMVMREQITLKTINECKSHISREKEHLKKNSIDTATQTRLHNILTIANNMLFVALYLQNIFGKKTI